MRGCDESTGEHCCDGVCVDVGGMEATDSAWSGGVGVCLGVGMCVSCGAG